MRESTVYQEILKEGELRGEFKGKLEDKLEGKLKVASNLLKRGMPLEEVVILTDLSVECIQSLSNDLSNN